MTEIEEELRRFERELDEVLTQVRTCVQQLCLVASDDLRFLIAERLHVLGSSAVPALQEILDNPDSTPSVRYLAAWVAIQVGNRGNSISVMCAEVDAGTIWSLPAAGVLARYHIHEGVSQVAAALARVDPQNTVELIGYATALRDLDGRFPETVRQRILAESPSWVARVIDEDFRSGS